jgi:hypothetical protein
LQARSNLSFWTTFLRGRFGHEHACGQADGQV